MPKTEGAHGATMSLDNWAVSKFQMLAKSGKNHTMSFSGQNATLEFSCLVEIERCLAQYALHAWTSFSQIDELFRVIFYVIYGRN